MKKQSVTFMLNIDSNYLKPVSWTLEVFAQYSNAEIILTQTKKDKVYTFGFNTDDDFSLSSKFWKNMNNGLFSWSDNLDSDLRVRNDLNEIDYLATAFYFINCIWERDKNQELDHWGRNMYKDSVWRLNGYDQPFSHVNKIFNEFCERLNIETPKRKSELFLSHDIDAIYSGWKEDGFSDLKRKKISTLIRLSWKALIGRPNWMNFDFIAKIEEKYNYKSTYYWINYLNKVKGVGKNADYSLMNKRMKSELYKLSNKGHQHGLHKSINDLTIKQEVDDFPIDIRSNRYHYLKFNFSDLIQQMEETNIEMDASLGYAEVLGYRNGYSLPFRPYNLSQGRAANFIEVPLVIMDATLSRYKKMNSDEAIQCIREFIDQNGKNSLISILWHNSHFSNVKYKGYADVYESTLKYAHEKKMIAVQPNSLIETYLQ